MTFSMFILAAILVQSIHISGMNDLPDEEYLQTLRVENAKSTPQPLARYKRQGVTDTTAATAATVTLAPVPITEAPITQPPPFVYPTVSPGQGTPGFACSPDLYKNYSKRCCYIPSVIDELHSTKECSKTVRNAQPFAITQYGSRRPFGKRSANYRFQFKQILQHVKPATPNGVLTLEQICLMDCIFRTERWLSPTGVMEIPYMISVLNQTLPVDSVYPPALSAILLAAYSECYNFFITAPPPDPALSINANSTMGGRRCFHAPTKWIRCLRRYLLYNCSPGFQPPAQQLPKSCGVDRLTIERCDIHTL